MIRQYKVDNNVTSIQGSTISYLPTGTETGHSLTLTPTTTTPKTKQKTTESGLNAKQQFLMTKGEGLLLQFIRTTENNCWINNSVPLAKWIKLCHHSQKTILVRYVWVSLQVSGFRDRPVLKKLAKGDRLSNHLIANLTISVLKGDCISFHSWFHWSMDLDTKALCILLHESIRKCINLC